MSCAATPTGTGRGRVLLVAGVLIGLLASAVMVWHSSRAAFTAKTTNTGNAWAAGALALSDDDSGSAQFSTSGIVPGNTQTKCITVTFGGSLQSAVTLYATASTGALRPYLNLTVEEGDGGGFGSCAGFVSSSVDYAGTLADFVTTRTAWSSGVGFFAPQVSSQKTTYRFTTTLDPSTPDAQQGGTASADLRWEARSAAHTPLVSAGQNTSGELGTGTTSTYSATFAAAGATTTWTRVSAGSLRSCGIRADQSLWCWGNNAEGELGQGDTTNRSTPTKIGSASWTAISAGALTMCGIQIDGTLWCWGGNTYGSVGDGTTTDRYTPVQVGSATTWATVSAGERHVCATRTDGSLWCWGDNGSKQLGDNTTTARSTPQRVGVGTTWASVTGGQVYTCGLQTNGTVWCWGDNTYGQLGQGNTTQYGSPTQVGTSTIWTQLDVGKYHSCAIQLDGTLWCWGRNETGRLGDGTTTQRLSPVQVGSSTTWSSVSSGGSDSGGGSCAIRRDRTLWCWGANTYGQLGDGTTTQRLSPVQVATGIRAVSAGYRHTAALTWPGP